MHHLNRLLTMLLSLVAASSFVRGLPQDVTNNRRRSDSGSGLRPHGHGSPSASRFYELPEAVAPESDAARYVCIEQFDEVLMDVECGGGGESNSMVVKLSFVHESYVALAEEHWQNGEGLVFTTRHPKCGAMSREGPFRAHLIEYDRSSRRIEIHSILDKPYEGGYVQPSADLEFDVRHLERSETPR